jgi:hypothetical protein
VAGLLAAYTVPALLYLRSLRGAAGERILGRSGDPTFNLYVLKWGVHQLRLGLPDLWDANFFYPARGALAFSDHLIGPAAQLLLLLDLRLVPNAVAGYNLLAASSFVLAGAATAWVLRQSGRSWTAAVLAGGMYAFAPVRWAQIEHIQVLLAQWIPLTLWFWQRLLLRPSWRRAALFLPCYLLHLAGGSYLAYMIHLPMLALALAALGEGRRTDAGSGRMENAAGSPGPGTAQDAEGAAGAGSTARSRARAAAAAVLLTVALIAGGAVWLLYGPYAEAARQYRLVRAPEESALYAAVLASYLAPSESNLYAGGWHRLADRWNLDLSVDESRLFAGFLPTALCVAGVVAFWRRCRARPARHLTAWQRAALAALVLVAAASFLAGDLRTLDRGAHGGPGADAWSVPALGFALGLGLWLLARRVWGGNWPLRRAAADPWERGMALAGALCFLASFPIAFVPLQRVLPGLASLRAPGRFYVMTSLVVAVFAARGLDAWLPPPGSRRRVAVAAVLAAALALELAPAALPSRPLRAEPDFPSVYHYLRDAGQVHALLELPRLRPARETLYMYYSTRHWHAIANGYSGFIPPSDVELRYYVRPLPEGDGFRLLRRLGITHLVLHSAGVPGTAGEANAPSRELRRRLPDWERRFLGREVERVYADGADSVYRLLPGPPAAGPGDGARR